MSRTFRPDDPVLDVVDDADAVAGADLGTRARAARPARAARRSSATGTPALEADRDDLGSSGASSGRVTSWKTSSSGASSRSSIAPPSEERPQRLSSIEYGRDLGAALDRDAVLARVGDLLLAAHLPVAHRRDRSSAPGRASRSSPRSGPGRCPCRCSRGRSCRSRVSRACSTASLAISGRPERGEERVAAAVERVRLDRRQHVLVARTPRARRRRGTRRAPSCCALPLTTSPVLARLAEVDGERDDLGVVARPGSTSASRWCRGRPSRAAARADLARGRPGTDADSGCLVRPSKAGVWRVRSGLALRESRQCSGQRTDRLDHADHGGDRRPRRCRPDPGLAGAALGRLRLARAGQGRGPAQRPRGAVPEPRRPGRDRRRAAAARPKARILADRFEPHLQEGHAIGRIKIDRIGLDMVVVQGTDTSSLQKGPGHYREHVAAGPARHGRHRRRHRTHLPGARSATSTRSENGDEIRITDALRAPSPTSVQRHEVVDPSDVRILKPVGYDQLVMTACHPPYSASTATPSSRSWRGSTSSRSAGAGGRRHRRGPSARLSRAMSKEETWRSSGVLAAVRGGAPDVGRNYFHPEIIWDTSASGLPSAGVYRGRREVSKVLP